MRKVLNRAGDAIKIPDSKVKLKNLSTGQRVLYILALLSGFGLLATIIGSITIIFTFTAFSGTLPSPQ